MELVHVTFYDHFEAGQVSGWHSPDDLASELEGVRPHHLVGIVVREDDRWIAVSTSLNGAGGEFSTPFVVLKSSIVERRSLGRIEVSDAG